MKHITLVLAALVLGACATADHRHVVESEVEGLRAEVADLAETVALQAEAVETARDVAETALEAAAAAQACCAANSERMDRMFEAAQEK